MIKDIKIAVIGGDMRQVVCAACLAEKGYEVALYGFERCKKGLGLCTRCDNLDDVLEKSNVIILPLPATRDGLCINTPLSDKCIKLDEVLSSANDCKMLLCGSGDVKLERLCNEYNINYYDYYKREDIKVLNALPTAEGALAIAVNEMPETLHGSECLCLGYGRIGKVIARLLLAYGAKVKVCARKSEDRALASVFGCQTVSFDELENVLPECSLIINTVPKTVLDSNLLEKVKEDALIIDLASKPGGIDFTSAKQKNLNVIWALSLPGKTAPVTSGKIIAETILKVFQEESIFSERR